ncbi:hypothetical protein NQ317_003388 [Molorchus minor]|uniref:Aspartylglucosaminidase n=1 Tax=Molorchus minor TaxID=1323400 RepID=A0ABQ9K8Y4_9CUCU|nr:hypothetical protein NQ317_003388 [Molorchus minor]
MRKQIIFIFYIGINICYAGIPLVVNTWNFRHATQGAWEVLKGGTDEGDNALDALTLGCQVCQDEQCDNTVGYGGSPDENGETTLDALIFDGRGIRKVKNVIGVARHVLENTEHSILVGSLASDFAYRFNFPEESLQTNFSLQLWQDWKNSNCQPNFWDNVFPDPRANCGPYTEPDTIENNISPHESHKSSKFNSGNHDTIGMIVISGTVESGIPPIPGAGAYADSEFGAAVATGDGDIMMRFLPSFLAVEQLRLGASPTKAAKIAIDRIAEKFTSFFGGVVVSDKKGNIGAACNGMDQFPFTVASDDYPDTIIKYSFATVPLVVNTWNFPNSALKAWEVISESDNALDALTDGINVCEHDGCSTSVGYGGSPDENGETTLDALIFDGDEMDMGAVGSLRRVKDAILIARRVLDYTDHSFIVGDLATEFATKVFNFTEESLQTNYSRNRWEQWQNGSCQPNFWKNMEPDASSSCGPYTVSNSITRNSRQSTIGEDNHDTIGMIVISGSGHAVAGTSTNGLTYKIPGRVGDSPIAGAGAYANSEYGAAVATGNGDIMMRFLPSFLAIELLSQGMNPSLAANTSISRIVSKYPSFSGALIVADIDGNVGVACNGMATFPYVVVNEENPEGLTVIFNCTAVADSSERLTVLSIKFYVSLVLFIACYS